MAIILNDNIKINAGKPSESKYLSTGNTAYSGTTLVDAKSGVTTAIPISERHLGLTVLLSYTGETNVEYWFKTGVAYDNLEEKKFASEQLVGDFVTGATNLGYFSGQTGIQRLDLNGFPITPTVFDGYYYSEYNWYYADADGIIRIGSPTHNGPLRRAYVNSLRTKSWIYDVGTSGWILSWSDVVADVGNSTNPYSYSGTPYQEITWLTGWQTNLGTSITGAGSLTTGSTVTIGNPVYSYKADQDLNFRTPISDTPEILKITNDDNYVRFSGSTGTQLLTASNGLTKVGTDVKLGGTITGDTIITDSRVVPSGITYVTDYSSSFVSESLVTKRYVDTKSLTAGGGERIFKMICQTGHGFVNSEVVGWSGATVISGCYNKPIANGLYDGEVLGIVSKYYNADCFELTQAGYVTGLTASYIPNSTYFLSDTIAGSLTPTEPTTPNYLSKSMLIATSNCTGWVLPYAGYVITSGVTGGALVKSVCNPTIPTYNITEIDYYIGVSGGSVVNLQPNINGVAKNGTVIIVSDICGNATPSCYVQIAGSFFGGSFLSCIDTAFGSLSAIYNSENAKWDVIGFSVTPH